MSENYIPPSTVHRLELSKLLRSGVHEKSEPILEGLTVSDSIVVKTEPSWLGVLLIPY